MHFARVALIVLIALIAARPSLLAFAGGVVADLYAGTYENEQVKLDLKRGGDGTYAGQIHFRGKQYPATARDAGGELAGTFESGGHKFDFTAAPGGGTAESPMLTLRTGGAEYKLRKPAPAAPENPLAGGAPPPPAAPNPLAGGEPPAATPAAARTDPMAPAQSQQQPHQPPQPGERDPLAYKVQQLPGGTIAVFENWVGAPVAAQGNMFIVDAAPKGRERDFVLRTVIATPDAADLANLFTLGPQLTQNLLQQLSPSFRRVGEQQKTKCGGDEALIEEYAGQLQGKQATARVMYVRRNDVGIAVLGIGTDAGMKEFGRSIEIVAQSITFKESQLEPELIGTWVAETTSSTGTGLRDDKLHVTASRSITILPNATFTDSSHTTTFSPDANGLVGGESRGRLVKRGSVLTFHYDSGKTWSASYEAGGGGMKLDGRLYLKQ